MTKTEMITAIMNETEGFKISHLQAKKIDEVEKIYNDVFATEATEAEVITADQDAQPESEVATDTNVATTDTAVEPAADDVSPDADEQKVLATVRTLEAYTGTDAEMIGRDLLKKVESLHKIPFSTGRKHYRSLVKKGYFDKKGQAEGKKFTTFTLTALGIQYLTDNDLLTAVVSETPAEALAADIPTAEVVTEEEFNAQIWLDDLNADYGNVTSEMLDELVATEILTRSQAEEIYDLSCRAAA